MTLRRLLVLAAVPVAAVIAACQDAYAPKALYSVVADTLTISALTGTPLLSRSAVHLLTGAAIIPSGAEGFDFALDLDANNNVLIIPRSRILTCTQTCQLGAAFSTAKFDSLLDAPSRGYTYDSVTTVGVGKTVVFVTKEASCIASNIATIDTYAKLVVDSVNPTTRQIYIRTVTDPNCGFRTLVPGIVPKH